MMMMKKIPTVTGPIDRVDGKVLLCEYLFHDFNIKLNNPEVELKLENLSLLYDAPSDSIYQLTSNQDMLDEFQVLRDSYDCHTIVDLTYPQTESNLNRLSQLSITSQMNIIVGTMISTEQMRTKNAFEIAHLLEKDLKFGIENTSICAGFIGPVQFPSTMSVELIQPVLTGIATIQQQTQVPVYFMNGKYIDTFKSVGGVLEKTIICHADQLSDKTVYLKQGITLLFDSIGYARIMRINALTMEEPLSDLVIANMLNELLLSYKRQIFLSNGIYMKTQFKRYGGSGYSYVFSRSFLKRLTTNNDDAAWKKEQSCTFHRLFQWWTPEPLADDIPKHFVKCDICTIPFEPIEGQYYTKFNFQYCSLKCLRRHAKQSFKAI